MPSLLSAPLSAKITWNQQGLVPVVAQDIQTGQVLMMAWMDKTAFEQSVATGEAVYWSRSRGRLWKKGETSGHIQKIREIRIDCDGDTLLLLVEQIGGSACHTGAYRCFYRVAEEKDWQVTDPMPSARTALANSSQVKEELDHPHHSPHEVAMPPWLQGGRDTLPRLQETLKSRRDANPQHSYVAKLFQQGPSYIGRKLGEEAIESLLAGLEQPPTHLVSEMADLWFHSLVLLTYHGISIDEVLAELQRREGVSGLTEKASRETTLKVSKEAK